MMKFICIGAPRSGTSWLYRRLNELPDVNLPKVKEIHYFDRSPEYKSPSHLNETKLVNRIVNYNWTKKAFKKCLSKLINREFEEFRWFIKYYFRNYSDNWYADLFDKTKISGDITPAYSILKSKDIEKMKEIFPDAKIIYLLRNPIERSWSFYRKNYLLKRKIELPESELIQYLDSESITQRGNSMENINRFLEHFPPNQILIGFYEALIQQPYTLLNDIAGFIGADTNNIINYCKVNEYNNSSPGLLIPDNIMSFLFDKFKSDMELTASLFGSYSSTWMNNSSSNENNSATILLSEVKSITNNKPNEQAEL